MPLLTRAMRSTQRLQHRRNRRRFTTGRKFSVQRFTPEANMSSSFTVSESATFTVTHARHMGAKVAADLKRMQRFYGSPSDLKISRFEAEIVELLKHGYLGTITYGFKR